jgi:hypothetical protein
MGFTKILFRNIWMTSKRAKNNQRFRRMNSLVIPLKELSNVLAILLEILKNLKKMYIMTPLRSFFHSIMPLYLLHQSHQWIYKNHKVHVMSSISLKTMLHVDYFYKLCMGMLLNGIIHCCLGPLPVGMC